MVKTVLSSSIRGISGSPVSVETDVSNGLPSFSIVGLGDTAIQESRDRVRAAIRNSGFSFPAKRVTVNLAPAELRKSGPAFDLAIALGIVAEECGLSEKDFSGIAILGELALDGSLRKIGGVIAHAASLAESGVSDVILPLSDAPEAARIPGIRAFGAENLLHTVKILEGRRLGSAVPARAKPHAGANPERNIPDYSQIAGQERAKRALEIAAAGGHNVLLEGAP